MRITRTVAALLLCLGICGIPFGCSGGVVGGECRPGFGVCEGHCLDLRSDPAHCGDCDHVCGAAQVCTEGVCSAMEAGSGGSGGVLADASAGGGTAASGGTSGISDSGAGGASGNAGRDGAAAGGGNVLDGSSGGGSGAGGSGDGSVGGGSGSDGGCPPPFNTAAHCGACNVSCTGQTPLCDYSSNYFCAAACTPPLVHCGNECVNTDNDENNCGRCNHRCASGICQGGQCVGATAGHETLFCMDYRTTAGAATAPEQLLENAVFLAPRSQVRILAYSRYTSAAVVAAVGRTLDNAAAARQRSYKITTAAASADVANDLSIFDYDLLLIYDQPNAPAGQLAQIGAAWASAIDSFARAGGSVVVLAGDGGIGEMDHLITSAGLPAVTGQTSVTNTQVYDRAPGDAVGINAVSPFRAPRETCTFTTPAPTDTTVFVVTDTPSSAGSLGAPVVIHRVLAP